MICLAPFERYPRILMAALLMLGVALLTGCTDGMLTETQPAESADEPAATSDSKLRHAHLLGRSANGTSKRILERYEDLSTSTEFVLGVSSTTLDMNKVLERYDGQDGVHVKNAYRRSFRGFALHVDGALVEDFLAQIENDADIAWAEPDIRMPGPQSSKSNTNIVGKQHLPQGIEFTGGPLSPTVSGDGEGTVDGVEVFLIDTAVNHDDLNVVETIDFTGTSLEDDDLTYEHGTHVAGTIAASDDDDGVVGIAPGANLHSLRVVGPNGGAELSDVIAAVEHVTAQKLANPLQPMVVNISLGADIGTTEYNALDEAIQASINAGVVYVLAAGNDAIDASTVTPAHVEDAITIGAVDQDGKVASFSNYGKVVDLYAPGVSVGSLEWDGTHLLHMNGTSMAAPHATGAVALAMSYYPSLSPSDINQFLDRAAQGKGKTKWVYVGDF